MSLPNWERPIGKKLKKLKPPKPVPKQRAPAKRPNYKRILEQFTAALANLKAADRRQIPEGTLPEMMVAWALVKNKLQFQSQQREGGGQLRLGGGVVDFLVQMGSSVVVVRVNGDYWHSLPERKRKDELQAQLLRLRKYRLVDLWEHDIYVTWTEGRLIQWVADEIRSAQ